MKTISSFVLLLVCCISGAGVLRAQNISTFAGNGTGAFSGDGAAATAAELFRPYDVKVDGMERVYIADGNNQRVRRVSATGVISTFAGNGTPGYLGDGGAAASAEFNGPFGIAIAGASSLYIADFFNDCIRFVNGLGTISTYAGNTTPGYAGDGGIATAAEINSPGGVARDLAGNVYIADYSNNRIRMVSTTGVMSTFAGNGTAGYSGDGGPAGAAEMEHPIAVAVDLSGNIYFSDQGNNCVRMINPSGTISTFAGSGPSSGYSGDGGPATAAKLFGPWGLSVDGAGNVYIADYGNNRIRRVDPSGVISTYAGTGALGFSGDGGPATAAELNQPSGVAVDPVNGNVFIADQNNNRIRMVNDPVAFPTGTSGLCVGATITLTDATAGGAWSSSNAAIATVSAAGVVTGVSPGPVSIIYSTGQGSGWLIVNVKPTPTLSSSLTPPELCTSAPFNYTPMSTLPGTTFTWARATVAGVSNASATGAGNPNELLTVTAAVPVAVAYSFTSLAPSGCSGTQFVTVTVDPLPSAGTITGPYVLCEGITLSLTDDVAGGTWSSSNANATVAGGAVTGVAAGAGAIIYTFTNVCGSVTTIYPITIDPATDCHAYVQPASVAPTTLKVYPNPNDGVLTVDLSSGIDKEVSVIVTNAVGVKVKEFTVAANEPVIIKSDLPAGVYFLSAVTLREKLTEKFVIGNTK